MPERHPLIREARCRDAAGIWPLVAAFATSFRPRREAFETTFAELIDAPRTLLLVAEGSGGDIVGYLLGNSHPTFFANGPVAWIEEVMVEPGSRGDGAGRRLVERAEQWARLGGAAYLALASRRAGSFYLGLGYQDSAKFYRKLLV